MASIPLLRLSLHPPPPKPTLTTTHTHHKTHLLNHPLHPKLPTKFLTHQNPLPKTRPIKTQITNKTTTPATDRLISAVGYFLPFINGLQYGRFLFTQYPPLTLLFEPLIPIFSLLKTVPYASFIAFFSLYLGVVRNPSFSHYVRFNAMQALVLDVLLVLPLLLQRIFTPGRSGFGFKLMVMGHNGVFVFVVFCFVYSFVSSLLGKTPYLPFVADAAGRQL
ncbi:hypothetical protein RND81_04G230800 [Saponaria officinalis]|uniref:Protein TIC 20 n=1 Tax=Saponaria officinalis TaxID=3572 RepID=A0AAW1LPV5_SAPOF